jgi:Ca-activated chloride channel family protein
MVSRRTNHYSRLGVPLDANTEEIRQAYRRAVLKLHPDTNENPGETELFIGIQEAFEVVSAPEKRKVYDASLPKAIWEEPVKLEVVYSRTVLPRIKEPQLLYVLASFYSPNSTSYFEPPPLNLGLVLDCSTSMRGEYLDTVKSTAIEILHQLRKNDVFSLVSFSDKAQVIIPAGTVRDPAKIEASIFMLRSGGGTEIFRGLEAGYQQVARGTGRDTTNHIILITDGCTYGDEDQCRDLANKAKVEGVTISALGIGPNWNDTFLDELVVQTGGNSTYIRRPDELRRYLLDKILSLGKSYAQRVAYQFESPPGVTTRYVYRLQPEPSCLPLETSLQLGSIPERAFLQVLFEFMVESLPADADTLTLAKGQVHLDIPSHPSNPYIIRLNINRKITPKTPEVDLPPIEIMQALSQVTVYRMQENIQNDLEAGHVEEATHRMKLLATNLLERGEQNLAQLVLEEAEHLQADQSFSDDAKKQIKYGTRSLRMPGTHASQKTLVSKVGEQGTEE